MQDVLLAALVLLMAGQGLTMRDHPLEGSLLFLLTTLLLLKGRGSKGREQSRGVVEIIVLASAIMGTLTSFAIWLLK